MNVAIGDNHGINLPAILETDEVFNKVEDFHKYADTIIGIRTVGSNLKYMIMQLALFMCLSSWDIEI